MPEWKDTVNLPRTDFPMKANLPTSEPETLARWAAMDVYGKICARRSGRPKFILHDGPPYANGNIHIGTALNKILKDLVVKSHSMANYDSPYEPGYDCHGLPIELQVDRELGPKKREMSVADFCRACRAYAQRFVGAMSEQFKRLGILGNWDDPYLTMDFKYQAAIARALGKFVEQGLVYKGKKPVHWCIHCRTALAEAEVEYEDHSSPSIYVEFPLAPESAAELGARVPALAGRNVSVLIWTTTPWTIPSNLAIAFHPEFDYGAYMVAASRTAGERAVIVAEALSEQVARAGGRTFGRADRADEGRRARAHPLPPPALRARLARRPRRLRHARRGHRRGSHRAGPRRRRLPHGREVRPRDLHAGRPGRALLRRRRALRRDARVRREPEDRGGAQGARAAVAPRAVLAFVPALLALPQPGDLPGDVAVVHRDGRPAPQFGRGLRETALSAIDELVQWVPAWGRDRMYNMIANRPDWCISRQRAWGVPIPAVDCAACGEALISVGARREDRERLRDATAPTRGTSGRPEEFIPEGLACPSCGGTAFEREMNILDVWFDSGSSHEAVLSVRPDLTWPADVYLEGSDQHRGWFQSSLLVALGTRGRPPFRDVVTHGFIVAEDGRKMSKSLGNSIEPSDIIKESGADILRLWVSMSDYTQEIRISKEILARAVEAYRKIRNTLRIMAANLYDFDPARDRVEVGALEGVDRYILARYAELAQKVVEGVRGVRLPDDLPGASTRSPRST